MPKTDYWAWGMSELVEELEKRDREKSLFESPGILRPEVLEELNNGGIFIEEVDDIPYPTGEGAMENV